MRFCFIGICCALLALQLSACKTPALAGSGDGDSANDAARPAALQADPVTVAEPAAASGANRPPSILSIILNAKAQGQTVTWTISKVSVKEGHFKHNFAGASPDYLKAYFTDDVGNRLDSNLFEDPLKRRMEYPADDKGKLATKMVSSAEGAAYLRANSNDAITTLQLYTAGNKLITTFHLNEYLK